MSLRRNLLANYLGQGWSAIMGLAFVPLYIEYLGMEAYGLMGLFAVMQAWLTLLDMGMTPTLNREMARFTGGGHSAASIRDLLRSVEWIAVGFALLLAMGIWLASGWLASDWLRAENLSIEIVAQAFAIMGVVTALRFVEGIYRSCILGLQRQVLFNAVNAALATVRGVGAVVILIWVSPTIEAFFFWQGMVSIVTLVILACVTYQMLPRSQRGGRFSLIALSDIWRFAGGMMSITLMALLLTQVDKILLSKLLTLGEFGYYSLAATVAGALYMLIGPVSTAWYPKLCELHVRDNSLEFADAYHKGSQMVAVIAGSAAIVVMLFSETLLHLWTQNAELAERTALLASLLMLGNLLNGLCHIPYQAQLAYGITGLGVKINMVAVLFIVPTILWAVPIWGAVGAACVWVVLNVGYVVLGLHFMYRRILSAEKWRWYRNDVIAPLTAGLLAAGAAKWMTIKLGDGAIEQVATLVLASVMTLSATILAGNHTRSQLKYFLDSCLPKA